MRKTEIEHAFYVLVSGLLGLALLFILRSQTLRVPEALRVSLAQGTWTTYANGDAVQALAIQGDYLWVGSYLGGLVRWDTRDHTYVQYLYHQTGLPGNDVRAVAIDGLGRMWAGTDQGIAVVSADGGTIVAHHTANSGLPANGVTDVGVAPDGRVGEAGLRMECRII